MKNNILKVLFTALLVISFITQAQANPWLWPARTPVKTVQLALPCNNGGVVSVTVPVKTTSPVPKGGAGYRRAQDRASTVNQREDERIAADLERHF
jgi:hypothetical protein